MQSPNASQTPWRFRAISRSRPRPCWSSIPASPPSSGPNGSGKSNITDALRWVLGESAGKTMRARRLEDVIFAGSDKRAPAGLAEVRVTFNNEDGWLPLEFSEVVVTRRVARDGDSEFLINTNKVRLRDLQDLFARSGLGPSAYAIMGAMLDRRGAAPPPRRAARLDRRSRRCPPPSPAHGGVPSQAPGGARKLGACASLAGMRSGRARAAWNGRPNGPSNTANSRPNSSAPCARGTPGNGAGSRPASTPTATPTPSGSPSRKTRLRRCRPRNRPSPPASATLHAAREQRGRVRAEQQRAAAQVQRLEQEQSRAARASPLAVRTDGRAPSRSHRTRRRRRRSAGRTDRGRADRPRPRPPRPRLPWPRHGRP